MDNQKARDALAVFASAYVKRWLEGHFYNRVFQTQLGKKLKALDKDAKYAIEVALNLLTTFFDQKLSDDTVLRRLVKEVGLDAGPEVSKRLINAKDRLKEVAASPREKELVSTLLQLKSQTLVGLLNWLYSIEATDRAQVVAQITRLSPEELLKLVELPSEDKDKFLSLLKPHTKTKEKRRVLSNETINKIEAATARIKDVFKAALDSTVDVTKDMVAAYWAFIKKLGKWSIILWLALLPLPIVGSIFGISWLNGIYLALVTLIMTVWLIAAFPIVMLAKYSYEEISRIRKTAQIIAAFLFWGLLLAIYFYLVPVWNYPAAIPLVFIMSGILAVGFMRFGIGINPKLAIGAVVVVFCLMTNSFYMPTSRSAASSLVGWVDSRVAGLLTSPLRMEYNYYSIETIVFFDPITGEARVWYYPAEDGTIELFHGPGYHPQYKVKLEPITPDIVGQIKSQLRAHAERISQEEQRKKEEAERIARGPKAPKKMSRVSVEDIVFFDPLTAEARVWYYAAEDGTIELFDGPGYHPQHKVKLESITPDIVGQIKSQLRAHAERISQEQQRKKEEAERIARSPKAPKRIRPVSIEDIVFFDPLTAESRVWYSKGDDGRIELFDAPGYHPQYKETLQPITPDIVAQLKKQLEAQAEKIAEELQKQREEQARSAAKGRPRHTDPNHPIGLVPEHVRGQVQKQENEELVKRPERFIEPEEPNGQIKHPEK